MTASTGPIPEALAWARRKVELALSRVDDMAAHLEGKGDADKALLTTKNAPRPDR